MIMAGWGGGGGGVVLERERGSWVVYRGIHVIVPRGVGRGRWISASNPAFFASALLVQLELRFLIEGRLMKEWFAIVRQMEFEVPEEKEAA